MDSLQWMGAVSLRTADKNIPIIHTTPGHQLTSDEETNWWKWLHFQHIFVFGSTIPIMFNTYYKVLNIQFNFKHIKTNACISFWNHIHLMIVLCIIDLCFYRQWWFPVLSCSDWLVLFLCCCCWRECVFTFLTMCLPQTTGPLVNVNMRHECVCVCARKSDPHQEGVNRSGDITLDSTCFLFSGDQC